MNAKGIIQGQSIDAHCTEEGLARLSSLTVPQLRHLDEDTQMISSPLSRTRETSELLRRELGLVHEIEYHEGLREFSFGCWEGKPKKEAPLDCIYDVAGKDNGGETMQQVFERVKQVLLDVGAQHPDTDHIVVCHGGVCKALIQNLFGISWKQFQILNGCVLPVPKAFVRGTMGAGQLLYLPPQLYLPNWWDETSHAQRDVWVSDDPKEDVRLRLTMNPTDSRNYRMLLICQSISNPRKYFNMPQHHWPKHFFRGKEKVIREFSRAGFHVQCAYAGNNSHSLVQGVHCVGIGEPNFPHAHIYLRNPLEMGVEPFGVEFGEPFHMRSKDKRVYAEEEMFTLVSRLKPLIRGNVEV